MLNYNLNINSPLQQAKKNEDVRPPINWDFHSFASASDSTDLSERTFATMSIDAPGTNCIQVSVDSGNSFTTDGQYPVTASVTGSNWPITGSTTMSLFTFGITYDPTSTNQFYIDAVSASAAEINVNPSITGSIVTNEFSASEFYRWYVSGSVVHMKGNVYNGPINWLARNQSPSTTTGPVNGFTSSFNIVKDRNVRLVNLQEVTGSTSSSFNNVYALNITSSLTASIINDATGSTTMSINIPEAGITTSSILFNSSSAGIEIITASFTSSQNQPYNITASVIFNKGNIWNAKVNWLTTGSNSDSYSLYTIPTQFNIFKDVNVDGTVINQNVLMAHSELTQSVSGEFQTQYAFNFETEVTESGTYPIYQVHTFPTTSLTITPAGTSSLRNDSGSIFSYTEFPYTSSYDITASAWINKIPALDATIIALGGGAGGGGGAISGTGGYRVSGGGGGAGGFVQYDVSIIPNVSYDILSIGTGGTGSNSGTITAQRGGDTLVKFWLGPIKENGTGSIAAEGGYGGAVNFDGSFFFNQIGGKSGAGNVSFVGMQDIQPTYLYQKASLNGGLPISPDNAAGGGGGITGSGFNGDVNPNGGFNLGGGGGLGISPIPDTGGTGSIAPTVYFQSSSFTWTGSAGNGGYINSNGFSSTALGGGGGGAFGSSSYIGGNGMSGAVIVAYSGSAKLDVPAGTITTFSNGVTWHLIKNTGSFSYNYTPIPNPEEQEYIWRAETLVIAGGGMGGSDEGGGGGAGGYSYNPYIYYDLGKTYNVTVGAGQPGNISITSSKSGSDSYIVDSSNNTLVLAKGGGAGFAQEGGSGGGASNVGGGGGAVGGIINYFTYVTSSQTQGFNGGSADDFVNAGGGGGAANSGSNGTGNPTRLGIGGIGKYDLSFTPIGVCGGGNEFGGPQDGDNVIIFGGGAGALSVPGTGSAAPANRGGGGGGARTLPNIGGAGGSGKVQIRYAGTERATGGQIETGLISGSYYTLHTFTSSGIFTPTR